MPVMNRGVINNPHIDSTITTNLLIPMAVISPKPTVQFFIPRLFMRYCRWSGLS